jgi:hypothetical protein
MLVDKLRVAQHGIRASSGEKSGTIARRFRQTFRISESLVASIADAAGELNAYIRTQVIDLLSPSLGMKTRLHSSRLKGLQASRRALDGPKSKIGKVERRIVSS